MKKPWLDRMGDFVLGKGFYIVLFLCVATIGISGYFLMRTVNGAGNEIEPVTGNPSVVLPDDGDGPAVAPAVPTPVPTPSPAQSQEETQTPVQPAQPKPQETPPPAEAPAKKFPAVYTWPVKGEILHGYTVDALSYDPTMGDWRTHAGLDISSPMGASVLAMRGGIVSDVYDDDLMGTTVAIDHGEGMVSAYSNLAAKPTVKAGDEVATGAVIGTVGETAIAEGKLLPHVHVGLTVDGVSVDPLDYLPEK